MTVAWGVSRGGAEGGPALSRGHREEALKQDQGVGGEQTAR